MSKKILITGASGGFGKLTAKTLVNNGHKVVGTMRSTIGKNEAVAAELRASGVLLVELDVTNDESVERGVAKAIELLGGLDVVVNNAGVGVLGLQEQFTVSDWKKLFEVNVFGVQRIIRATVPTMRAQGSGLLVYVSSLLGRITIPFYGPYNSSKWALEGMAENYRSELSAFGIENAIVEPGGYQTDFFNALIPPSDHSRDASMGDMVHGPKTMFDNFEGALASNEAQNPQNVADAIAGLIDMPVNQKPFRTVVDKMGMGDHLEGYNQQLEQITNGIFSAFGIEGMLKVQVREKAEN